MSKNWIFVRAIQIFVDAIGIFSAFIFAYFLRVGFIFSSDFPFFPFAKISAAATFFWSAFLIFTKFYRVPPRSGSRRFFDFFLIFLGGAIAIAFLLVTFFFEKNLFFSRLLNFYALIFGATFLIFSNFLFLRILANFKKNEKKIYRTIIVGANRTAEKIISAIEKNAFAPHKIVGVIDPYGIAKKIRGAEILGKLNRLEKICDEQKISSIIQCDAFEHTINLISICDEKKIKFQFAPALRGILEENLRIRETAGINFLSFVQRDFRGAKKIKFKIVDFLLRQIFDVD